MPSPSKKKRRNGDTTISIGGGQKSELTTTTSTANSDMIPSNKISPESLALLKNGRRGDPRMHRAVAARLANPDLTLFQALIEGGFKFPSLKMDATTNNKKTFNNSIYDSDNVLLSQRKNQLSRRLRLLLRKGKQKLATSSNNNLLSSPLHEHQQHRYMNHYDHSGRGERNNAGTDFFANEYCDLMAANENNMRRLNNTSTGTLHHIDNHHHCSLLRQEQQVLSSFASSKRRGQPEDMWNFRQRFPTIQQSSLRYNTSNTPSSSLPTLISNDHIQQRLSSDAAARPIMSNNPVNMNMTFSSASHYLPHHQQQLNRHGPSTTFEGSIRSPTFHHPIIDGPRINNHDSASFSILYKNLRLQHDAISYRIEKEEQELKEQERLAQAMANAASLSHRKRRRV